MKRVISFFALGVTVVIAIAATVKISDLPLATNPSTNTFVEIADMNAATKSLKYPLDSVPSYARITNAMAWSGNTNLVIGGDGRERTVAGGSSLWYSYTSNGSTNILYATNSLTGALLTNTVNLVSAGSVTATGLVDEGGSKGIVALGGIQDGALSGTTTLSNALEIVAIGDGALNGATIKDSNDTTGIADDALYHATVLKSYDTTAIGDAALKLAYLTNAQDTTAIANSTLSSSTLVNTRNTTAIAHSALSGTGVTNSQDTVAIGNGALVNSAITDSFNTDAIGHNAMSSATLLSNGDTSALFGAAMGSSTITNSQFTLAIGDGALGHSTVYSSFDTTAIADNALFQSHLINTFDITAVGDGAISFTTLDNSFGIGAFNGGLKSATLTNSSSITAIGPTAGASLSGNYTNIVFLGDGSTAASGTHDQVILGPGMAISAGSTNSWKLGAVKTCTGLTMSVTNYIEVVINGVTNAIPLCTITP